MAKKSKVVKNVQREKMVERFSINRENHDLLSEYCSYKNIRNLILLLVLFQTAFS